MIEYDEITYEYVDEYNNSEAEDYGVSYESYTESRTNEDYWG